MARTYKIGEEPITGYRLMGFLGRGAFGEVWKASGPGGTLAAVKLISLSGREGQKEFNALRLVKTIRHPNLVPIMAIWLKDEKGQLLEGAMEPALPGKSSGKVQQAVTVSMPPGGWKRPSELVIAMGLGDQSLFDRLEECRAKGLQGVPPDELLDYMDGAARAIDFLNSPTHDLGEGPVAIQHCDIKPQNIMIVGGAIQVCDFGLARALQADVRMTTAAGSPAYGAPELLQGIAPSATTDQYSLAISYVELRTGDLPFDNATSVISVIKAHLDGRLVLAKLLPLEREVIRRATDVDPLKRYTSTMEMVKALRRAYDQQQIHITHPGAGSTTDPDIVPGYRLVRKLRPAYTNEVWEARGPNDQPAMLLIRDLDTGSAQVDAAALAILARLQHPGLEELLGFWLLNEKDQIIQSTSSPATPAAAAGNRASRLVIAHRLPQQDLLRRMQECRRVSGRGIPLEELLAHMREMAATLDYLNTPRRAADGRKLAIIHGNLCPSNMLLREGRISLCNFGLARLIAAPVVNLPATGNLFDHPYIAPEVIDRRLSRWSDQASLAVAYCHLRTGEAPFDADSSMSRLIVGRRSGSLDLSGLIPGEADVVERATCATLEQRFNSCSDFVEALEHCARATGSSIQPPVVTPSTLPPPAPSIPEGDTVALPKGLPVAVEAPPKPDLYGTAVADTRLDQIQATPRDSTTPMVVSATSVEHVPRRRPVVLAVLAASIIGLATAGWLLLGGSGGQKIVGKDGVDSSDSIAPRTRNPRKRRGKPKNGAPKAVPIPGVDVGSDLPKDPIIEEPVPDVLGEKLEEATGLASQDPLPIEFSRMMEELIASKPLLDQHPDPATLANWLALQIVDASTSPETETDLNKVLSWEKQLTDRLREFDSSTDDTPSKELRKRAMELSERRRAAAIQRAIDEPNPRDGLATIGVVLKYDPADAGALVAQGLLSLRTNDLMTTRKSFDLAAKSSPDVERRRIQSVSSILKALAEQKLNAKAVTGLRQALRDAAGVSPAAVSATLQVELIQRLFDRAIELDDVSVLTEVIKLAIGSSIVKSLPSTTLDAWRLQVLGMVRRAIEAAQPPKWGQLLSLCNAAGDLGFDDSLLQLCSAEAIIESSPIPLGPMTLAESERAMRLIEKSKGDVTPYANYVRARVEAAKPMGSNWIAVGDGMASALAAAGKPEMAATYRRQNAAAILVKAADGLLIKPSKTFVDRLGSPYVSSEAADAVHRWMPALDSLVDNQDPNRIRQRMHTLLAAWRKPDPDRRSAAAVAKQLSTVADDQFGDSQFGDYQFEVLLALAQVQAADPAAKGAALRTYARLAESIVESAELSDDQAPTLFRELLEPALALPGDENLGDDLKSDYARVLGAKGDFLTATSEGIWKDAGIEDPDREALAAYELAGKLDPSNAKYFVGSGFTRLRIDPPALDEAQTDGEKALELDANLAGAHALLGTLAQRRARETGTDAAANVNFLKEAASQWDSALVDPGETDSKLESYLINASNAYLLLANFTFTTERDKLKERLDKAVDYAEQAVELGGPFLDYANRALGNALEDLAWLAHDTPEVNYDRAEQAFSAAIEARLDLGDGYRDRGRCRVKRVIDGKQDLDLDPAEADLEKALQLNPSLHDAHRWLGELRYHRGLLKGTAAAALAEVKRADTSFETARNVASQQGDSREAEIYKNRLATLQNNREVKVAEIFESAMTNPNPPLLAEARIWAGLLQDKNQTAVMVARTYEAEKKWPEALSTYADALPRNLDSADASQVPLLIARAQMRIRRSDRTVADINAALADSDRAAVLAGDDLLKFEAIKTSAAAITTSMSEATSENTPQKLARAIEQFAKADELAQVIYKESPQPDTWQWRTPYVQLILRRVAESSNLGASEKRALLEAATRSIKIASQTAPVNAKKALARLQTQVDRQKASLNP